MLRKVSFNICNVTVILNYLAPFRIFSIFLSYFCKHSDFVKSLKCVRSYQSLPNMVQIKYNFY